MPVTIKQIAQETGLSIPTVSRILNKNGQGHRSETTNRVLETARRLGYRVNSSAQATRRGHFGSVGLLLSTIGSRSILPRALMEGILDALAERDLRLVLSRLPDERLTSEDFMSRMLRESASDGLLINYNAMIPEPLIALIEQYQIPAVWINSRHSSDCVFPDDRLGAFEGTEQLIELGHRRIAYVDFIVGFHYSTEERLQGYLAAMEKHGLEPILVPKLGEFERMPYFAEVLTKPDRPTAVLTYSPQSMQPVLFAAYETRCRIPEDFSLLTFDETSGEHLGKRIGTMLLPQYDMAQTAIEMLMEKIKDPQVVLPPRGCRLNYRPGDTCKPRSVPVS
ncbi:MAG: substrate-binding domain-containing protein [Armatimonadaceae bacterium]